jgi:hypothetical protein
MVRIIDMECSIPRTEASQPEPGHDQAPTAAQPAGYGMANYRREAEPNYWTSEEAGRVCESIGL